MSTNKAKAGGSRRGIKRATNWPPKSVLSPGEDFKWMPEVIFDLHNTLVDWTGRFAEFVNLQYGHSIDAKSVSFYHMQFDPENALTNAEFLDAFVAFARRAKGGYGDLEPYDGVVEALKEIKDAGIDVKVWTWTPGAAEARIDNGTSSYNTGIAQGVTKNLVAKLGLDPDRDLRFIKPGEKKYEMIEEHIPLMVEDSPETAVGVGQIAHAAILVPESYNAGIVAPNVLRLDHRGQLAPTVIDFFKKLEKAGVLHRTS
ncbi:MAG: hypothetical protein IPM23_03340 [Candidatus Melainabacteria bacterium]|nr:hypothetical protein [Candidatus Melainabacteria bacterium]